MTAHDLLSQLREKGVEVKTSGDDRLIIDAPKGTITEDLRAALAANKAELLEILKAEQAGDEPAAVSSQVVEPITSASNAPKEPVMTAAPKDEDAIAAASAAEEIKQLEVELMRLRTEEAA